MGDRYTPAAYTFWLCCLFRVIRNRLIPLDRALPPTLRSSCTPPWYRGKADFVLKIISKVQHIPHLTSALPPALLAC
jgi:hypothetical protein